MNPKRKQLLVCLPSELLLLRIKSKFYSMPGVKPRSVETIL